MGDYQVRGASKDRYEDQCIRKERLEHINYQPGTALKVILPGRGEEEKRRAILAWVEGNYNHHIVVRIDTPKGSYRQSLSKIDIAKREVVIKEIN